MTAPLPMPNGSSTIQHVSLTDSVHGVLKRLIVNNELEAGTRLVEATLAREMGVSRATLRVALRQLAQEGLVYISPRRQSVVTRMSAEEIADACYARYVLEEGAVRAIPAEHLNSLADALAEVVSRMESAAAAAEFAAIVELDSEFHGCIIRESGKHRLATLWETLNAQMGAVMRSSIENQHIDLFEVAHRHRELGEVFRTGDGAAMAAALSDHYLSISL